MNIKKPIFCKTIFCTFMLFLSGCQQNTMIVENTLENAEFHIEDNILLGYSGTSVNVVIPESIETISEYAFADSAVEIEKITIPSSVVHIDARAFFGLSSLQEVVLDVKNPAFVQNGPYLLSRDGSIIFAVGGDILDIHHSADFRVFDIADQISAQGYYEDGFQLVFYDSILSFREPDAKEDISSEHCRLYQIEGNGHIAEIPDILTTGNHTCSFYRTEDLYVFTDYFGDGSGDTYLFSKTGIWEQHTQESISDKNYNDAVFSFYRSEDGALKYWCSPRKYLFSVSAGDLVPYSVGRTELYRIYGSVSLSGKEPVFTSEDEINLGEKYDDTYLISDFQMYHKNFSYTATPPWNTLDELFEYNMEHYEEFTNVLIRRVR